MRTPLRKEHNVSLMELWHDAVCVQTNDGLAGLCVMRQCPVYFRQVPVAVELQMANSR